MEEKKEYAVCMIRDVNNSGVTGLVKFIQEEGKKLHVIGSVSGLTPGLHGMHIHEFGNLMDNGKWAGDHFNPYGSKKHGSLNDVERHAGDLGNIEADASGYASFNFEVNGLKLIGGIDFDNIIGRSMMIHALDDDLGAGGNEESCKTGNVGHHVAMGIIGLSGPLAH